MIIQNFLCIQNLVVGAALGIKVTPPTKQTLILMVNVPEQISNSIYSMTLSEDVYILPFLSARPGTRARLHAIRLHLSISRAFLSPFKQ